MAELAPVKSHTDPPAPEEHKSSRTHLPRRLHANSFRSKAQWGSGNHHLHRPNVVKNTVQSAVELKPPINFDHILRKTPGVGSKATPHAQQPANDLTSVPPTLTTEPPVRAEDVAKAKRHNVKREEELRASLKSVEEIGRSSTRQLDDTYYGILEKASLLRSAVASLQHLADESKKMQSTFTDDTSKLQSETVDTLKGFDNFNQQEKTINELVNTLQESRSTTDVLNDRLESARLRVEAYEQRENAKQAKRKAQWRITSAALLGLLIFIIAILVARDRKRVGDVVEQQLHRIGDLVDDVAAPIRLRPSPSEDPYLQRLFDEL